MDYFPVIEEEIRIDDLIAEVFGRNSDAIYQFEAVPTPQTSIQSGRVRTRDRATERERIRRLRQRQIQQFDNDGPQYDKMMSEISCEHNLGQLMSNKCVKCHAFLFKDEITMRGLNQSFVCCQNGNVKINIFNDFPDQLRAYLDGSHPNSKELLQNIRIYNNALAMGSVSANMPISSNRNAPRTLSVQGQMYRNMSAITPTDETTRRFAQLYVLDPDAASERRRTAYNLNPEIIRYLSSLFLRKNVLAQSYRMMGDVLAEEENEALRAGRAVPTIRMTFVNNAELDLRRYNEPTTNEVAIVYVVNDETEVPPPRCLTVFDKGAGLKQISELNSLCDPLTYPLIYPTGRKGWEPEMLANGSSGRREKVTQREYYAFLLFTRNSFNAIHLCKRLFQQYVIDAYIKIETSRLRFHRNNQDSYRMESVAGLTEFLEMREEGRESDEVGKRIILPSSFVGSPRSMKISYQDAMAVVGKFGKPDLFITFTTNVQWTEIKENLLDGQNSQDRPDIIARVFQLKLNELLDDISKRNLFGKAVAFVAIVEWQKRGLPHCHILVSLDHRHKIRTAYQTDKFIRCDIPNARTEPDLYKLVVTHMLHRSCYSLNGETAPCYICVDGVKKCSKGYPKMFNETTTINENFFPIYKRENDGRYVIYKGKRLDNRYVVPYCPFLLLKYNSHINVEVCGMVRAVKYLFKYVYKGHDRARLRLDNDIDEINEYVDGRYICAPEAVHRILGYKIERRSHSVFSLHVHEQDNRWIRFRTGQEREAVDRANEINSTLEAWFSLNRNENNHVYGVDPRSLNYVEIPTHFLFRSGEWVSRRRYNKPVIGRIHYVSPEQSERFALRIILLHKKGATSFEDLKTVEEVIYQTFSEAARAMGLLVEDNGYRETIAEAATFHMPHQLRNMFALLLGFNDVTNGEDLWNAFKDDFADDYFHDGYEREMAWEKAYYEIAEKLRTYGKNLETFIPRPEIPYNEVVRAADSNVYERESIRLIATLNIQQKMVFDKVTDDESDEKVFFIDGPGGSGKTYLYKTIYNYFMSKNKNIVCTAWTGIAALLLPEGRTCHSLFKLPFDFNTTFLGINRNCREAKKLRKADVIIWDEFSMVPGKALKFVNDSLKYIMESEQLFGGKKIICGGDFRQILPVEEVRGSVLASTVKGLELWNHFVKLSLTENMRVEGDGEWTKFLLDTGSGKNMTSTHGSVSLPQTMFTNNLVRSVFGEKIKTTDVESMSSRVILAPKNISVNHLNEDILDILEGEHRTYVSIDQLLDSDEFSEQISVEFLNNLNPPGFPPSKLRLKVGAVVILLRNLDISSGLANGTRLTIMRLESNVLTAKILTGPKRGDIVILPKISLICDRVYSIKFKRHQFPVKLSFAMSINKAQRQTFSHVGIYLLDPVFSHGQLYVALSRCSKRENIFIQAQDKNVLNIVEKRILQ